jgi:hypothetical protein
MLRFKDWACTSRVSVGETIEIIGGSVVERMWVGGDRFSPQRLRCMRAIARSSIIHGRVYP